MFELPIAVIIGFALGYGVSLCLASRRIEFSAHTARRRRMRRCWPAMCKVMFD
jgi:hypothetical protein